MGGIADSFEFRAFPFAVITPTANCHAAVNSPWMLDDTELEAILISIEESAATANNGAQQLLAVAPHVNRLPRMPPFYGFVPAYDNHPRTGYFQPRPSSSGEGVGGTERNYEFRKCVRFKSKRQPIRNQKRALSG
jgi:hypothetical protein